MEASPAKRPFLNRLFFSSDEPRLRAGWRLLAQTILLFVLSNCLAIPLIAVWGAAQQGTVADLQEWIAQPLFLAFNEFISVVAVTLSVFLARRLLDKRSFRSLGLEINSRTLKDVLAGFLITFAMMALIYALEWAAGWLKATAVAWEAQPIGQVATNLLLALLLFSLVAWSEELLARGYHLQTIASGLNLSWGVLLSALIFSLLHLGNPSASWQSVLGIWLAGLFLAYGYIRTKQLWLPMGLHLGWNFFEGAVFGFPVSGLTFASLIQNQFSGPEFWTGGDFGPEAGLILIPALLFGFVLIHLYTKWRRDELVHSE